MTCHSLSVLIPTKNSEERIGPCIESISNIADEIIVLDGHSEDSTVSIVKSYEKTEVIQSEFEGFGALRQKLLSLASCEWVLYLDSDEKIPANLRSEIDSIVSSDSTSSYRIPRKSKIFGEWMLEPQKGPLRLGRRDDIFVDPNSYVHENIQSNSEIKVTESHMLHYNYSSISEYISNMNQYTSLESLELVEKGESITLPDAIFKSLLTFGYYLIVKKTITSGLPGVTYAVLSSFYEIIKYLKYKEVKKRMEENNESWKESWLSNAGR